MARNADVTLTAATWTQLTADDATVVAVQNKSGYEVIVMATTSASAPSASARDGYVVRPFADGLYTLATAFPGLTSPVRMYAYCEYGVPVFVSHD
jgi:hypothetical protein